MVHGILPLAADTWDYLERFIRRHGLVVIAATWVSTLIGTAIAYWQNSRRGERRWYGWLAFCFPRDVLHHRSSRLDFGYFIVRGLLHPFLMAPILIGHLAIAVATYGALTAAIGVQRQQDSSLAVWLAIVAACVVLHDGINFHTHYFEHKIRVLWETHKVHHSTEFLLPISNQRVHPLQELLDNGTSALGVGLLLGAASYVLRLRLQDNLLAGLDAYYAINALSFYHLRHSHVRLTYGWLERVLLSPTQHQIHHACDQHLWDKNFGLMFSMWDQLYGTIVYSTAAPSFRLGLPPGQGAEYDRVWKLFVTPFRRLGRMAWPARRDSGSAADGASAGD